MCPGVARTEPVLQEESGSCVLGFVVMCGRKRSGEWEERGFCDLQNNFVCACFLICSTLQHWEVFILQMKKPELIKLWEVYPGKIGSGIWQTASWALSHTGQPSQGRGVKVSVSSALFGARASGFCGQVSPHLLAARLPAAVGKGSVLRRSHSKDSYFSQKLPIQIWR